MKYTKQFDGDSVILRDGKWRIGCCDCGLVHDLTFTKVRGGIKVGISMNNRATSAKRRAQAGKLGCPNSSLGDSSNAA